MNAVTDEISLLESMKTALGMAEWGSPKDAETILQEIIDEFHPKLTAALSIRQGGVKALDVDELAQEIRRVDGNNELGAGALAEALLPFLSSPAQEIADKPSAVSVGDVRPLDDWHEDMGDVVWWCWRDGAWLGEPAYIGSPLNLGYTVECHTQAQNGSAPAARFMVGGWPGYHTHWTEHPAFPPPLKAAQEGK